MCAIETPFACDQTLIKPFSSFADSELSIGCSPRTDASASKGLSCDSSYPGPGSMGQDPAAWPPSI